MSLLGVPWLVAPGCLGTAIAGCSQERLRRDSATDGSPALGPPGQAPAAT